MKEEEQNEILVELRTDIKYIKKFVEEAPDRFASKWTEKVVAGLIGLVMITVGSALVAGVLKAAELTTIWVSKI